MDEIKKHIEETVQKRNNAPVADFEGYSPNEMQYILYDFFNANCVVQFKKVDDSVYEQIPIFNQIKFLYQLISENDGLSLTKTGRLPIKVVAKIYEQGFIKDYFIENGISKLYKEEGVQSIELSRILMELSNLVKKKHNKLSPTVKGKKIIADNHTLLTHIFEVFATKFNWAYFDGYDNENVGQFGFGFSLILLHKFGKDFKPTDFYANKYLHAFDFDANNNQRAYAVRTFERFLKYFELTVQKDNRITETGNVKRSSLFNELIEIRPHTDL